METAVAVRVLLVEDNAEFARLVRLFLAKFEDARFEVIWKENGLEAIEEAKTNPSIDVILMDYYLPGKNGLEVTRELQRQGVRVPVVFLTVNKDMAVAVEVMKLGVRDYLVKEDITTPILPKTLLSVVQKRKLEQEIANLEIRKKRLEAMQELIGGITNEISHPLAGMKHIVERLASHDQPEKVAKYLSIIRENIDRLENTIVKLQNLQEDKTVQYIKDIQMIDLSQ